MYVYIKNTYTIDILPIISSLSFLNSVCNEIVIMDQNMNNSLTEFLNEVLYFLNLMRAVKAVDFLLELKSNCIPERSNSLRLSSSFESSRTDFS